MLLHVIVRYLELFGQFVRVCATSCVCVRARAYVLLVDHVRVSVCVCVCLYACA